MPAASRVVQPEHSLACIVQNGSTILAPIPAQRYTRSTTAAEKGAVLHDSPLGSKSFQYFIQLQIEDFAQRIQPVLRHINVFRFLESKACHVL